MSLTNVIPPTPEEGCQGQPRIAGGSVYLFTCFVCVMFCYSLFDLGPHWKSAALPVVAI